MVNGPDLVYVEQHGKLTRSAARFTSEEQLRRVIERIVSRVGRRIDESSPLVDARLPDGSRVNAVIAPMAFSGSSLTIRKFAKDPFKVHDLIGFGTLSPEMAELLRACVQARLNIIVSGGTGTGKTTLLNVLSSFIPEGERIVTIEDAVELQLQQEHVVRLESRPPNVEGTRRDRHPRAGAQLAAHAARPHRRRRGPRRGVARHAAGDEHRPRRLALHRARQLARATPSPGWRRWS